MKLTGKVALITGAARSIGKTYADTLLKAGAKVSIVDVLKAAGEETEKEFNDQYGAGCAIFIRCDITNKDEFEAAFIQTKDTLGGLDIVVNNAGIGEGPLQKMMDINVTSVMRSTYLAVDHMSTEKGGQGGVVINISSLTALQIMDIPGRVEYSTTKKSVLWFTQSYALLLGRAQSKCGVRVNTLCPGYIYTDLTATVMDDYQKDPDTKAFVDKYGGWLTKEELAQSVVRLVEDDHLHNAVLIATPGTQTFRWNMYE